MGDCASAARAIAGLDDNAAPNTKSRRMDDASDTNDVLNDDADLGVVPDIKYDKLPGLTPEHEDVDNDSNDNEDSVDDEELNENSVGNEESTVPSTV